MSNMKSMVEDFLAQKRVAVVGVSRSLNKTGDAIYDKFNTHGYEVFPINPHTKEYKGVPCYPSVKDVPGGVQAAMLVTSPENTDKVVRECAEAGVSHVWMHNAFSSSVSDEAVQFCKQNGINVIPGACPMMYLDPDFGHVIIKTIGRVAGFVPR
jgi:predicted CoA-binding protein